MLNRGPFKPKTPTGRDCSQSADAPIGDVDRADRGETQILPRSSASNSASCQFSALSALLGRIAGRRFQQRRFEGLGRAQLISRAGFVGASERDRNGEN